MVNSYLKIAFRNLFKHKHISFINIFGLAVGLACAILILLFVLDELRYDKHYKDSERIYRVVKDFVNTDGSRIPDATTPPALGTALQNKMPEIEYATTIYPGLGLGEKYLISYGDKKFYEKRFFTADSNIFKIFSFDFVKGNPNAVVSEPHSIVITESAARKYFGNEDPVGKLIGIGKTWTPRKITALIKDIPDNSHFHFDFLFISSFQNDDNWGWHNFFTYIKVRPEININLLEQKIQDVYQQYNKTGRDIYYTQALTDIHLNSNLQFELEPNGDKLHVYIFSVIGLFVIIIACINYINLSTARASIRAKEIGVRKVNGALRISLVKQLLLESVLIAFIAFLFSVLFASLLLPSVNQLAQKSLSLFSDNNAGLLITTIVVVIIIGLTAGIYPALYLSSFKPVFVLKGISSPEKGVFNLRKTLVVLQFVISTALICGTLIVHQQVKFLQESKLGLDKEQVMVLEGIGSYPSRQRYESFKNSLLQMPGVKKVAGADGVIGGTSWAIGFKARGSSNEQLVNTLAVGEDFLEVMGIHLEEGRAFVAADTLSSGKEGTDRVAGGIILNEKAVKDLQLPLPAVGQQLVWKREKDTAWYLDIVGVVKDFHFSSLRNEIKPFGFMRIPDREFLITVKLSTTNMGNSMALMEKKWNEFSSEKPFEYYFLDERFDGLYQSEERFGKIFLYAAMFSVVIACLGLFGLSAFTAERRPKEIGIRKVLGASVTSIVTLLSKEFIKLILIACIIAFPIAWYIMHEWLQDFAYRINVSWWIFFAAGLAAIVFALVTIGFQAIKAAVANPVKSLRTE